MMKFLKFLSRDVGKAERGGPVAPPLLLVLLFYYTPISSGRLLMKAEGLWLVDSMIGFVCFFSLLSPWPFVTVQLIGDSVNTSLVQAFGLVGVVANASIDWSLLS